MTKKCICLPGPCPKSPSTIAVPGVPTGVCRSVSLSLPSHHLRQFQVYQFSGSTPALNQNLQGQGPDKVKLSRWFSWAPWVSPSKIKCGAFQTFSCTRASGELVGDLDAWAVLLLMMLQDVAQGSAFLIGPQIVPMLVIQASHFETNAKFAVPKFLGRIGGRQDS